MYERFRISPAPHHKAGPPHATHSDAPHNNMVQTTPRHRFLKIIACQPV
ncbi:hypothetical protein [Azospirillum melinis]